MITRPLMFPVNVTDKFRASKKCNENKKCDRYKLSINNTIRKKKIEGHVPPSNKKNNYCLPPNYYIFYIIVKKKKNYTKKMLKTSKFENL